MKKKFLENWTGGMNSFGQCEQFKRAQGSSLKPHEKSRIESGGVAFHEKGKQDTKVFVEDEDQNMWSATIRNSHLADLNSKLEGVGYLLPAA